MRLLAWRSAGFLMLLACAPSVRAERTPFKIFDNLYYVGIDWVAAYVLETSEGLILIDSLYGKWINPMLANIAKLGLDPNDIKYVLVTHGHFDHHGGAAVVQQRYGAKVVMTEDDWLLAETEASHPLFAADIPRRLRRCSARRGIGFEPSS